MPTQAVRLAHTSDVHLDGSGRAQDFEGFRNVAEYSFARVVDGVIEERCDIFLVVGDLFDNARVPDSDFDFVAGQLGRLEIPVVLIPGNHDVHDERSLWTRFDWSSLGENVHALQTEDGESINLAEINTRLWGRAMTDHAPENQPLAGVPVRDDLVWNVGLAHGQVVELRNSYVSSMITTEEIAASGFDYLALGHVHVWNTWDLNQTVACYPGSPVQAFASSKGGFYAIVDLDPEAGVSVLKKQIPAPPKKSAEPPPFHFTPGVF